MIVHQRVNQQTEGPFAMAMLFYRRVEYDLIEMNGDYFSKLFSSNGNYARIDGNVKEPPQYCVYYQGRRFSIGV